MNESISSREAVSAERPAWSLAKRLAFRTLFLYTLLFWALIYLSDVPGLDRLYAAYGVLTQHLSARLTGADASPEEAGITYSLLLSSLMNLCFAAIGAAIWSARSRVRDHVWLHEGLHSAVRLLLGITMLGYGFAKVLPGHQFPAIGPETLTERIGDATPMHLLWTFMGYSKGYQVLCGMGEVAGALLLFWRRTTLLGALILATVLINVVALNICYDVPVKLPAAHYLFFCLLLAAPDARALFNFFMGGRSAQPSASHASPLVNGRLWKPAKALYVIAWIGGTVAMLGLNLMLPQSPFDIPAQLQGAWRAVPGATGTPAWRTFSMGHMGRGWLANDLGDPSPVVTGRSGVPPGVLSVRGTQLTGGPMMLRYRFGPEGHLVLLSSENQPALRTEFERLPLERFRLLQPRSIVFDHLENF